MMVNAVKSGLEFISNQILSLIVSSMASIFIDLLKSFALTIEAMDNTISVITTQNGIQIDGKNFEIIPNGLGLFLLLDNLEFSISNLFYDRSINVETLALNQEGIAITTVISQYLGLGAVTLSNTDKKASFVLAMLSVVGLAFVYSSIKSSINTLTGDILSRYKNDLQDFYNGLIVGQIVSLFLSFADVATSGVDSREVSMVTDGGTKVEQTIKESRPGRFIFRILNGLFVVHSFVSLVSSIRSFDGRFFYAIVIMTTLFDYLWGFTNGFNDPNEEDNKLTSVFSIFYDILLLIIYSIIFNIVRRPTSNCAIRRYFYDKSKFL